MKSDHPRCLFERVAFPLLTVVFLAGTVLVLIKADAGAAQQAVPGAFWIVVGSSFGYTGGWTVGAADYARYLRPDQARPAGWYAAIGNFTSSTVLQIAGVAAVTAVGVGNWNNDDPAASYASLLPGWLGHLTLIAIFIGALSANSVNLYSSSLSFATMGVRLPTAFARAAIAVVIGRGQPVRRVRRAARHVVARQLPAGHRLLDRPVAGRRAR